MLVSIIVGVVSLATAGTAALIAKISFFVFLVAGLLILFFEFLPDLKRYMKIKSM